MNVTGFCDDKNMPRCRNMPRGMFLLSTVFAKKIINPNLLITNKGYQLMNVTGFCDSVFI